ncbi:MAG: TetR/AcrR family transcriptional regulator [Pseudomonadota bacterium]
MPRDDRHAIKSTILDAAAESFADAGFAGARMQDIADRAGLPKPNLHYHFGTKKALYAAVLEEIVEKWLTAFDHIVPTADPAAALTAYIRQKMADMRSQPIASRVFASELLSGGTAIEDYLKGRLRNMVEDKAEVIQGWIDNGQMAPVDPFHLFFALWANTQTYADFAPQMSAVLGKQALDEADYRKAEDQIIAMTLRGCGLEKG